MANYIAISLMIGGLIISIVGISTKNWLTSTAVYPDLGKVNITELGLWRICVTTIYDYNNICKYLPFFDRKFCTQCKKHCIVIMPRLEVHVYTKAKKLMPPSMSYINHNLFIYTVIPSL